MFSVIMPAYNVEAFIGRAIQSIRDQTFEDWELIVVDDGSRDDTLRIARQHAQEDTRVRVIAHPHNRGLAATYQTALDAAIFDWVTVLDSDDFALPNALTVHARAIEAHPEVVAWGSSALYLNAEGRFLYQSDLGPKTAEEFQRQRCAGQPIQMTHAVFTFRRQMACEVGGYHVEHVVPDADLMDRLSDRGIMLTLPAVLAECHMRSNGTTVGKFFQQAHDLRFIWERRAAQNRGETLTYAEYQRRQAQKPALPRLREYTIDRGRYHWLVAGLAYGNRKWLQFIANLLLAFLFFPRYFASRFWMQVRTRLLPHRAGQNA